MCKIIGIDISKQTFDVVFKGHGRIFHKVYANNSKGFQSFFDKIRSWEDPLLVMEASGPYYLPLASYFYSRGIGVCVVNPLMIKRFSQMKFYRAKTDKKDAQTIMEYGEDQMESLILWQPQDKQIHRLKQMHSAVELLQKQVRQSKNQLAAFATTEALDQTLKEHLVTIIAHIEERISAIESQMIAICQKYYKECFAALRSIPGIGPKTALLLIAITDNFEKFEHYKQLIAYVGFSPRVYQSGSSVKGKGHICKMGKAQIRKLLYMCSWTAKRYNKACKEMYDRLKEKGKPERVIKVAIANKLLKQAFAIANSKQKYIENYQPNICF